MFDDNICSLFLLWFLLYPGNITVTMHIQCHVGFEECIVYSLRSLGWCVLCHTSWKLSVVYKFSIVLTCNWQC